MPDMVITPTAYDFFARLLMQQCGLVLSPGKDYLLRSRLAPIMERHKIGSLEHLMLRLQNQNRDPLVSEVVEAMVTTETSFFRDFHPFETLRTTILPKLIEARRDQRQLNIWCAASSSGQEPYSIAILLREYFPELESWRINFLATDISREMLTRCREGRYSQFEVNRGLPTPLLLKWFHQQGAYWLLDERIRNMVSFSQINLPLAWPSMPMWDLVFMRNVMIYFETEAKKSILTRVARSLARDGYLILGGAETTFSLYDGLVRVENLKSGYYHLRT